MSRYRPNVPHRFNAFADRRELDAWDRENFPAIRRRRMTARRVVASRLERRFDRPLLKQPSSAFGCWTSVRTRPQRGESRIAERARAWWKAP